MNINQRDNSGMSIIVKRITRITVALIFLYGVYILLHGHLSPGGGFAGGVIIALSFIHVVLAFGRNKTLSRINERFVSITESIGALMFLGIATLGFLGGYFFLNILPKGKPFDLLSSGSILASNIAIFLKVGMGLFLVFLALASVELFIKDKEKKC